MKIKKISKIDNIFSYSFFNWDEMNPEHGLNPNDPPDIFKKTNIIFAENGNGKSVLVDIFKSLNGQEIKLEKNWDRPPKDKQEANVILYDDIEIFFDGLSWSTNDMENKFVVFDKHFIDEFVHSIGPHYDDTPQRRQKRGRNIIYLGNFADYNLEIEKINSLKNTISEKNSTFFEKEQLKITGLLSNNDILIEELTLLKNKLKKIKKDDLQNKKELLGKKQVELEKIEKALKEKNKILSLPSLLEVKRKFSLKTEYIELDKKEEITLDPNELFSFTISKGVQQTLQKIANKEGFIKQGISLITDKTSVCPFCSQRIKNGDYIKIIKNYQEIFDDNFTNEEHKIQTLLSTYRDILEEIRDLNVPSGNQDNLKKCKTFITVDERLPQLVLEDDYKTLVKNEIDLVLEKEKNFLKKISGSNINKIKTIIDKTNINIRNYDKSINNTNKIIKQLKADLSGGKLVNKKDIIINNIAKLNKEIFFIENKKSLERYFKALENNKKNKDIIKSLERIFQLLKDKIVKEFNGFVSNYFKLISSLVKEISPSMEIFDIIGQATYDRRNPRDPAQCGFFIRRNSKDCTGNLSEGEKQVIALAFFFAQLEKGNDKTRIIILDDPITSFDAGKRKSTAEVLHRVTKDFNQIFIFTCDPLFREYCLKQFENNRNFYYIFKTRGSSSIHYVPKKRETIYSSFETEFQDIEDIPGSNENIIVYGQKLRFCLETKIKEDYFGFSEDSLSNMIKKVTGRKREEFEKLFNNKDLILQIYSYCNTGGLAHYPKDGSTSWNELKGKIKQYLSLNL